MLDSRRGFGGPILTPSDRQRLPPASRLESTALHLEARGDLRNLVCFVERWAELGEPTPRARLAQARAFLALRMMDRAWIRLKEVMEAGEGGVEALSLTARMFIERGWPARARKPLEEALRGEPDDRQLAEIRELLARSALPPDDAPDTIPEHDDQAALVAIAERFVATGAYVKARALLERVRRIAPDNRRAADLLWVLDGDYSVGDASMSELVDRLGPDLSSLAELNDEAEHTESLTREPLEQDTETAEDDGEPFPTLFRGDSLPTLIDPGEIDEEPEVTQSSPMASLDQLKLRLRDDPDEESGAGDTQIARVIRNERGVGLDRPNGPIHLARSDETDGAFDLAAFRREMGMSDPGSARGTGFEGQLEEEDDSVIVLTRREPSAALDEPTNAGIETLEPDTTSEIRAGLAMQFRLHEAPTVITDAVPEPRSEKRKPRRSAPPPTPWWILGLGLILLVCAILLATVLALKVLSILA